MRMNEYWTGKVARIVGKNSKEQCSTPPQNLFSTGHKQIQFLKSFFSLTMSDYV
jgi:hypothetical protein